MLLLKIIPNIFFHTNIVAFTLKDEFGRDIEARCHRLLPSIYGEVVSAEYPSPPRYIRRLLAQDPVNLSPGEGRAKRVHCLGRIHLISLITLLTSRLQR